MIDQVRGALGHTAAAATRAERAPLGLTAFGIVALTLMLIFYALEDRAPVWTLWFAIGCVASSAYGFLQGAWPFGVVEAIWTVVALRRWRRRQRLSGGTSGRGH